MKVLDLSFPEPDKNLSYDDELLNLADKGGDGEALRFWESPCVFVVLGRTCVEAEEVDLESCRKDNIRVLRRSSGGGTVVQGPGCLNFSLVLSKDKDPRLVNINSSYQHILSHALKALGKLGINASFRPVCDLVLADGEKKFSGNAQRRGRKFILHHGTILYNFNLSLIPKYLKMPSKMPAYRSARSHKDFVTNIPILPQDFKRFLAAQVQ